jgi:Na+(H+)/acetate symporter ActP
MAERRPDNTRGTMAFVLIILLGYVLGLLIKRVSIGLILGLAFGLLASGFLRNR